MLVGGYYRGRCEPRHSHAWGAAAPRGGHHRGPKPGAALVGRRARRVGDGNFRPKLSLTTPESRGQGVGGVLCREIPARVAEFEAVEPPPRAPCVAPCAPPPAGSRTAHTTMSTAVWPGGDCAFVHRNCGDLACRIWHAQHISMPSPIFRFGRPTTHELAELQWVCGVATVCSGRVVIS